MGTNRIWAVTGVSLFVTGVFAGVTIKPAPPPPRTIVHEVPGPTRTVSHETKVLPDSCRSALEVANEMRSALRAMQRDPELQMRWLERAYEAASLRDFTEMNSVTQEIRDYRTERLGATLETLTAFRAYEKHAKECTGEVP